MPKSDFPLLLACLLMLTSTAAAEEASPSPTVPSATPAAPVLTLTPQPPSTAPTEIAQPLMPVQAPRAEATPSADSNPTTSPMPPANIAQPNPQQSAPAQNAEKASTTPAPTLSAINGAKLTDNGVKDGVSPAILRAEVMLDRLHVSPGVIDGRSGSNFTHALEAYEKTRGLESTGSLNEKVWSALTSESGDPVIVEHVLTDKDVAGPFYPDLPQDYAELAKLPSIGYRSPSQKLGATFHMGEDLLASLNPGIDLSKAGSKIIVADVKPAALKEKVERIVVDKDKSQVFGYDRKGNVVVAYPATIGSEELPSPSGTYKVKGVAYNPIYYYDPKNFVQGNNKEKLKLPAGPNNPVGSVFIALTKPTYGLHGTPDPSKIDKTASHGCVRMTNWSANELAHLVKRGVVVHFKK